MDDPTRPASHDRGNGGVRARDLESITNVGDAAPPRRVAAARPGTRTQNPCPTANFTSAGATNWFPFTCS